jgi:hypothetical protein
MEMTMTTPVWKVTVWKPLFRNGRGCSKALVIEAFTGAAAEAAAIELHPGAKVTRTERLSGFEQSDE